MPHDDFLYGGSLEATNEYWNGFNRAISVIRIALEKMKEGK